MRVQPTQDHSLASENAELSVGRSARGLARAAPGRRAGGIGRD
jgi:hypothetical protein